MDRTARRSSPAPDHERYSLSDAHIQLTAARNETLGFQLLFSRARASVPRTVTLPRVEHHDSLIERHYIAHYHPVHGGHYRWGPATAVLPDEGNRPDALVPRHHTCAQDTKQTTTVGGVTPAATRYDELRLPKRIGDIQALWIELFIPSGTSPGIVQHVLEFEHGGDAFSIDVSIDIKPVSLPDKTRLTAIAELYRSYRLEGAGEDPSTDEWRRISHCYQQMAHAHRAVFIERVATTPDGAARDRWLDTVTPILNGELFTEANGYRGPGMATPPSTWRLPWPQQHDISVETPLPQTDVDDFHSLAQDWAPLIAERKWSDIHWFAYVFDEVDGPNDENTGFERREDYIASVHADMARVQLAFDSATDGVPGAPPIDLLWTSHTNPRVWLGEPELDLVGTIRLWAPNAHAADPELLGQRVAVGETAWFYHSGHPAVGGHVINVAGTDFRSWGLIAARYGMSGTFVWAANLGHDARPYAIPSYRPDDDRIGNGTLVYPGAALERIGFEASAGPVPSMRLKAWHRGLQDAELYYLARAVDVERADAIIEELIPLALAEAVAEGLTSPTWPQAAAPWIDARDAWLQIAAEGGAVAGD